MRLSLSLMIVILTAGSLQAGDEPKKTPAKEPAGKRVACVGDSITAGGYPGQLQKMLDTVADKYVVKNFGVGGATMMMKSDRPYAKQTKYEDALKFEPDIVVLMLGT